MDLKFNKLTSKIRRSLVRRSVPKEEVIGIKCLNKVYKKNIQKNQPESLFHTEEDNLKKASSLFEVWQIIAPYYSFFDFEIISQIAESLGTEEDKQVVADYEKEFERFILERSVSIRSESRKDGIKMSVKLDSTFDSCEATTLKRVQIKASKILKLASHKILQLLTISEGCIELTFEIPIFIVKDIFPLSSDQQTHLKKLGILHLYI